MATAIKKSRAAGQLQRRARSQSDSASMRFVVFEDNSGAYRWRIVGGDGATLAQSESFASYAGAELAARHVKDGAASALFERPAGEDRPVDLSARRDHPSGDSDAERWLDEGGSFSSEAVAKSLAER
jgi:uncharacterized protein YegP (UPF0339 family)